MPAVITRVSRTPYNGYALGIPGLCTCCCKLAWVRCQLRSTCFACNFEPTFRRLPTVWCAFRCLQMPHSLQFEPMKLCGPSVMCLPAGSTLPETTISVLNGSKAKVVKALMAGRRHQLELVSSYHS